MKLPPVPEVRLREAVWRSRRLVPAAICFLGDIQSISRGFLGSGKTAWRFLTGRRNRPPRPLSYRGFAHFGCTYKVANIRLSEDSWQFCGAWQAAVFSRAIRRPFCAASEWLAKHPAVSFGFLNRPPAAPSCRDSGRLQPHFRERRNPTSRRRAAVLSPVSCRRFFARYYPDFPLLAGASPAETLNLPPSCRGVGNAAASLGLPIFNPAKPRGGFVSRLAQPFPPRDIP